MSDDRTSSTTGGNKRKTQISFTIRQEKETRHHSGIACILYDPALDRLHSASRDGIIRTWSLNSSNGSIRYVHSMEHHTDWVNNIVLTCGGKHIMSGSNDCTVKLWNAHKGFCMSTLRTHKDYVRALAYSKEKETVASAGFDRAIYLWDVNTLTALTATKNTVTTAALTGSKSSIYSLAMVGHTLVSGSTEKVLRVWDTRRYTKTMKLKGHMDNVKALLLNWDGTQCLSGSSDGTIKLWALPQQQCIQTIRCHSQGVWALAAPDTFAFVISGGRDCRVMLTDLRSPDFPSVCIAIEEYPILSLCLSLDHNLVWVGTTDSTMKAWRIEVENENGDIHQGEETSIPLYTIEGAPAIRNFAVLNDKRHIVTKDTRGSIQVYDALKGVKTEDLGPSVDYEEVIRQRNSKKVMYVPSWFSVGLHTSMVTIHLAQDENDCHDCLGAWVSAKEAGLLSEDAEQDQKVNYGRLLLQSLFEEWKRSGSGVGDDGPINGFFSVPHHTPVVIGEQGGKTMYRFLVRDAGGDAERTCLMEAIPQWVTEQLLDDGTPPKFIKILFFLTPHTVTNNANKAMKKERLFANDFISMRKVMEHVLEKMEEESIENVNVEERVKLYCMDQVLSPEMDLRTVKHLVWKGPGDLVITYVVLNKG